MATPLKFLSAAILLLLLAAFVFPECDAANHRSHCHRSNRPRPKAKSKGVKKQPHIFYGSVRPVGNDQRWRNAWKHKSTKQACRSVKPKPAVVQPKPAVVQPQPQPAVVQPKPAVVPPKPVQPQPAVVQPQPEPVVVPPKPVEPKPAVFQPQPQPAVQPKPVEPNPAVVQPQPAVVPPKPVEPQPAVVPPQPEPAVVPPKPVEPKPAVVQPQPQPAVVQPKPAVVLPQPAIVPPQPVVVPSHPKAAVQPVAVEAKVDPIEKGKEIFTHSYKPGPWKRAHATFYEGNDETFGGACGFEDVEREGYGIATAALSTALFNNGKVCGACFEIRCIDNPEWCKPGQPSLYITATNFCPPDFHKSNDNGGWCNPPREHFDIAYPAFEQIAEYKGGIIPVEYRRVPCDKVGGIKYTITGNPHFNLVSVWNVGGAGELETVEVKAGEDGLWVPLKRNWGEKWQTGTKMYGKELSFRVQTTDGRFVTSTGVAPMDWQYGQTFEGDNYD